MSSWVCVDANLVVHLVTGGSLADRVSQLWTGWLSDGRQLAAPGLLAYEVTSVLRRYAHLGALTDDDATAALDAALGLGIQLHNDDELHKKALEIARLCRMPSAYDAHYVALAVLHDAQLWTTDKRLHRSVAAEFPSVRLVE